MQVRLRHSFCFCSKSNNLYALTQHARETLLAPKGVQAPARKGQALGRSAPVHTNHRLSAAGHPRPLFVTAFIFNFVKYTTLKKGCQYYSGQNLIKILSLYQIALRNTKAGPSLCEKFHPAGAGEENGGPGGHIYWGRNF